MNVYKIPTIWQRIRYIFSSVNLARFMRRVWWHMTDNQRSLENWEIALVNVFGFIFATGIIAMMLLICGVTLGLIR